MFTFLEDEALELVICQNMTSCLNQQGKTKTSSFNNVFC